MKLILAAVFALALAGAACADDPENGEATPDLLPLGGLLLFYNSQGPLSSVTMTPRDVPPNAKKLGEVSGRSCQRGLSIPIAANLRATNVSGGGGDGSFRKAYAAIRLAHPEVAGLYDVRVDTHLLTILGIYHQLCTEIVARAFAAPAS